MPLNALTFQLDSQIKVEVPVFSLQATGARGMPSKLHQKQVSSIS